jgi:hypothetical protein
MPPEIKRVHDSSRTKSVHPVAKDSSLVGLSDQDRKGHIGFTGTRQGMTRVQREVLANLLAKYPVGKNNWFHHGDCIGADAEADALARTFGYKICMHPPLHPEHRAWCQPRSEQGDIVLTPVEYLIRNKLIVFSTEFLIGAPGEMEEQIRSGTWSTVRYARKLHRSITLVMPDGTTQKDN